MDPTFLELSLTILDTLTLFLTLLSSAVVTSLADIGLGFLNHQDVSIMRECSNELIFSCMSGGH